VLPFFSAALQGGNRVVAKKVGQVVLNFPAGSNRAQAKGQTVLQVSRAVATLPENARKILTRVRRPGQQEAAIDPLTDPAVRAAVAAATFEHLVGFQMNADMLRYNATR
jgi:regulator of protease activity HflC (stomatin/prohibitin superfamily)